MNRALGFRNSSLLEDYGLGTEELAELLNEWRDRALAKDEVGAKAINGRETARWAE